MHKLIILAIASVSLSNLSQAMTDDSKKWKPGELIAKGELSNRFIVEFKETEHSYTTKKTDPLTQEELTAFLKNIRDRIIVCIRATEPTYPVSEEVCGNRFIVSYKKDGGTIQETNPLNQDQLNVFLKNVKYLVVGIRLADPIHSVEESSDINITN